MSLRPSRRLTFGIVAGATLLAVVGQPTASATDLQRPSAPSTSITIGAYEFPESQIMAQLYAGVLTAAGQSVKIVSARNREAMEPRLAAGRVQLVPEYLGTFAEFLNVQARGAGAPPVASNSVPATLRKARALAKPSGIAILTPSSAQNVNAFAVSSAFATANGLRTLSDLSRWSQANPLRLAGPVECPQRPFCQPGLERVYGMKVAQFLPTDAGGPLTREAIDTGAADVGLLFSTDGAVAELGFTVLEDDLRLQNVDNLVPAIRMSSRTPAVTSALNRLSAVLTTADLVLMNKAVELDRRSPKGVAAAYLKAKGLT